MYRRGKTFCCTRYSRASRKNSKFERQHVNKDKHCQTSETIASIHPDRNTMGPPRQPKFRISAPRPVNEVTTPPSQSTRTVPNVNNSRRAHAWIMMFSVVVFQLCWLGTVSRSLSRQPILQDDIFNVSKRVIAQQVHGHPYMAISVPSNRESIPVFYNLFVNPDLKSDVPRVIGLVEEQLSLLPPKNHDIFVTTIGMHVNISAATMMNNSNATEIGYHEVGSEILTLHSLWEYCQNHADQSVMYLHSKGSFHNRPENDLLRRFVTIGAAECSLHMDRSRQHDAVSSSCDVCSSRFSPYPHPHTSGNMWTAKCSYVAKLINPLDFEERMETVRAQEVLFPFVLQSRAD